MRKFKITVTTVREVEVSVDDAAWGEKEILEYNEIFPAELSSIEDVAKEGAITDTIWENQVPNVSVEFMDEMTTAEITEEIL